MRIPIASDYPSRLAVIAGHNEKVHVIPSAKIADMDRGESLLFSVEGAGAGAPSRFIPSEQSLFGLRFDSSTFRTLPIDSTSVRLMSRRENQQDAY
jgi:hypothetical protein